VVATRAGITRPLAHWHGQRRLNGRHLRRNLGFSAYWGLRSLIWAKKGLMRGYRGLFTSPACGGGREGARTALGVSRGERALSPTLPRRRERERTAVDAPESRRISPVSGRYRGISGGAACGWRLRRGRASRRRPWRWRPRWWRSWRRGRGGRRRPAP